MIRKPYPIAQLTGGLKIDLNAAFLTDTASPNLSMVRFDKGLVRKDLGFANFGTGERVLNGDMEANAHWTNVGNAANCEQSNVAPHGGTYCWKVVKDSNANQGVQSANFPLVANANYTVSAWIKSYEANANTGSGYIKVYSNATLQLSHGGAAIPGNNSWTQMSNSFTCNATCNANQGYVIVTLSGAGVANSTVYVDDVTLTCDNPTDERIMYFDSFYETDGTEHFICCTPTRMYEYNSGVWEPVAESNVFTGDADDQFSSTVWPDLFILTNGQDTIKKWDGATFAALGGLSGISVTAAKSVIIYNSRVVLGHTIEGGSACPHRVRWSATGQPEQWDPATYADAGFVDLNDTSDWVVGFAILIDRLFVFKERSIWELLPTKDTDVFEARVVIDGVGTYAESSIISLGDVLIFFGSDDVYLFDGSSLKSVGESVYPWLYTTGDKKVNLSRLNRSACVYVEELGQYVLALPTTGDDPDWILKYDVNEENWTQRDKEATAFGFWSQADFADWSESTGYWDDAAYAYDWSSKALPPGAPITILGDSTGRIVKDDRLTTSSELMVWETKDFVFGHSERIVQMSIKCKGSGDFTVYYSTNQGRTYNLLGTHTPDTSDFVTEKFFMNVTCHQIRFKIQTEATSFDIMWIEPWYIDRSRTMSPSTD